MPGAIPLILSIVAGGLDLLAQERQRRRQSGELTEEQDAQLDQRIESMLQSRAWKTDEQIKEEGENPR